MFVLTALAFVIKEYFPIIKEWKWLKRFFKSTDSQVTECGEAGSEATAPAIEQIAEVVIEAGPSTSGPAAIQTEAPKSLWEWLWPTSGVSV